MHCHVWMNSAFLFRWIIKEYNIQLNSIELYNDTLFKATVFHVPACKYIIPNYILLCSVYFVQSSLM